ncbi:MAG: Uma2 family endonuclease [Acetobacteraceae bacterium]
MSAASKSPASPARMTVDEFLNWESGDGSRWQLVDGEPRCMAPANRTHGSIQTRLSQLLSNHLEDQGGSCAVVTAPGVVPHMFSKYNMRVPDLAVTCSPYEIEESSLNDPVLIIEILSPSNPADTWANVWTYTTIPSLREVLVVRTDVIACELLRRRSDNTWPSAPEAITSGDIVLESADFRVPLIDIYRTTRLVRAQPAGGASR